MKWHVYIYMQAVVKRLKAAQQHLKEAVVKRQ
jgi:hypothetical protein